VLLRRPGSRVSCHRDELLGAGRGGGEVLEGSAGGKHAAGDAAAEYLQPLEQRAIRVDRDARQALLQGGLQAWLRRRAAEQSRQPALLAELDDDRAPPGARREQPEGGGDGRLADATLASDHEQLAVEYGIHRRGSVSETRRRASRGAQPRRAAGTVQSCG
jgi:hypothetical protein